MFFYEAEAVVGNYKVDEDDRQNVPNNELIADITERFNGEGDGSTYTFVASIRRERACFDVLAEKAVDAEMLAMKLAERLEWDVLIKKVNEITFREINERLNRGWRNDFLDDSDQVLRRYRLDKLGCGPFHGHLFKEGMIDERSKEQIDRMASDYLMQQAFREELDRVYQSSAETMAGHPVHYMFRMDDQEAIWELPRLLLSALKSVNRLQSKRFCYMEVDLDEIPRFLENMDCMDALYRACTGGAVIFRIEAAGEDHKEFAGAEQLMVDRISECMQKYRHQVLTILSLPVNSPRIQSHFYEKVGNLRIVELAEEPLKDVKARNFLNNMAENMAAKGDDRLFSAIEPDVPYSADELNHIFNEWYNELFISRAYPQYQKFDAANVTVLEKKERGNAYEKLQKMIGLTEAKKVIDQALGYYKYQKMYRDQPGAQQRPSMHMVFTGNPGTAKTSVARLVAEIFRDNGILTSGHLVETGRSDLVGAYVGWTAKSVKAQFQKAQGGVLFIDEAYSLVDGSRGSYGDEAINTIVQEMENHRDDVIVILAGYQEEMERFLETNPGLRSRIAFHVPFADYNADELTRIARLMADEKQMVLTDEALRKIHGIVGAACRDATFGNGRYVRNLMERACMAHANRIVAMGEITTSKKLLSTLEAEDFEAISTGHSSRRGFGFAG